MSGLIAAGIGAAVSIGTTIFGASRAKKQRRRAERKAKRKTAKKKNCHNSSQRARVFTRFCPHTTSFALRFWWNHQNHRFKIKNIDFDICWKPYFSYPFQATIPLTPHRQCTASVNAQQHPSTMFKHSLITFSSILLLRNCYIFFNVEKKRKKNGEHVICFLRN